MSERSAGDCFEGVLELEENKIVRFSDMTRERPLGEMKSVTTVYFK